MCVCVYVVFDELNCTKLSLGMISFLCMDRDRGERLESAMMCEARLK